MVGCGAPPGWCSRYSRRGTNWARWSGPRPRPPDADLPESLGVLDALRRLQAERQQFAIVINEYGGIEGIVTVKDLLEELVGEINDEFDQDSRGIRREPDGSVLTPGSFPINDLADQVWGTFQGKP